LQCFLAPPIDQPIKVSASVLIGPEPKASAKAAAQSLVRYKTNDYSVPVAYDHHCVWGRGHVEEVVIGCRSKIIVRHPGAGSGRTSSWTPALPAQNHCVQRDTPAADENSRSCHASPIPALSFQEKLLTYDITVDECRWCRHSWTVKVRVDGRFGRLAHDLRPPCSAIGELTLKLACASKSDVLLWF